MQELERARTELAEIDTGWPVKTPGQRFARGKRFKAMARRVELLASIKRLERQLEKQI